MNILQVVEACGGGVGRHVRGLCEGLVVQGHQLTIAYAPHRADEAFRQFINDRQGEMRFVPLEIGREVSPVLDLRGVIRLLTLMKTQGPFDVVHGHSSKGGAIARTAGRCFGIPTLYTPHGLVISSPEISKIQATIYTWIERILGHWATSKIIAVSGEEYTFISKLRLVPHKRIALVENGIDDQDFKYFSQRRTMPHDVYDHPLIFGALMRFNLLKAPEHLVDAFLRLNAAVPHIPMRLVIAGDGELFAKVQSQVEASGLGEKVSLLGWRADTREILRKFDVYVLSSRSEAGAYAILEAMAAKLPIVSTDVFGTSDTIARVPGNILVSKDNPEALANGMKQMVTLTEPRSLRRLLYKIGQANHDYARKRFRESEVAHRTFEIYQSLC